MVYGNGILITPPLGPVCVVSIAGPCRKGKSYILSKAFEQGEVFPLGHFLDPETMGIWMWVVPDKLKVKQKVKVEYLVIALETIILTVAATSEKQRLRKVNLVYLI